MIFYNLGFLFSPDGKDVLLIQKNRPTYLAGKWNGLGGKIEMNETPVEAMVREVKEEANILIPSFYWHKFTELESDTYIIDIFFSLHERIYEAITTTDEQISVFHVNSLPTNTQCNVRWLIPMALTMFEEHSNYFQIKEINI